MNQYTRRNNVVADDILSSVKKRELDKCIAVLGKIDIYIHETDIETCYRLSKSSKTIIRFVNRKFCSKILAIKSEISDIENKKLTEIRLLEIAKLFVRLNLSPYIQEISFNYKELRRKGYIYSIWFYSGSVFVKKCRTDEECIEIHPLNQLPRLFPDFKFPFQQVKQG